MKSVWNRILRVDLSSWEVTKEDLPEEVMEDFLGGAGLGAWVLYNEVPADVKSFDPGNRIIYATGFLQGVKQTGAAKWTIVTKSPAFEANATTCITWDWGIKLKSAGYDALVVEGKADRPVTISIDDDEVKVIDASHLWGKDAYETEDILKDELGKDFAISTIGQAGEGLSKYACIVTGKASFAGRGGHGAVMGSKNLKAVAVNGSQKCEIADEEKVKEISKDIGKLIVQTDKAKPYEMRMNPHGTSMATKLFAQSGNLPIKNWQLGTFDSGVENLGAPNYKEELNSKNNPCPYCVAQCKNHVKIEDGPFAFEGEGPEYESFAMMGLNCLIDDMKAVAYGGHLANIYGLDTISLGACLAWAMESYEKGVLTKEDTYGIDLTWGNGKGMCDLVEKIGTREPGLGYMLGEGVYEAAKYYGKGSEAWAVHCNGLEMPAHDPRTSYVAGLTYLTGASCGGNHEKGNPQHIFVAHVRIPEFGIGDQVDEEKERHSWENAPFYVSTFQHYANIIDSAVFCKFMVFSGHTMTHLLDTFNAATGMNWDADTLQKAGERIFTLQRLLNIRYGKVGAYNKAFPERIMRAKPDGPMKGVAPYGIEEAVDKYFEYRNYDENGVPKPEAIKKVGLDKYLNEADKARYL